MTRGSPLTRNRVSSLYGRTVAGHLVPSDLSNLTRVHSRSGSTGHIRFQPVDNTLPRFRIALSEFPVRSQSPKWIMSKWRKEITVEPIDWPQENELPIAKFSPTLEEQWSGRNHMPKPAVPQVYHKFVQGSVPVPTHDEPLLPLAQQHAPLSTKNERRHYAPKVSPANNSIPIPNSVLVLQNAKPCSSSSSMPTPRDHRRLPNDGSVSASGNTGTQETTTPRRGYVCHRCNQPGHFINDCPTLSNSHPRRVETNLNNSKFAPRTEPKGVASSEFDVTTSPQIRPYQTPRRPARSSLPSSGRDQKTLNGSPSVSSRLNNRDFAEESPKGQTPSSSRRPPRVWFDEYLSPESIQSGLDDGTLISGIVHVNAKNTRECWIRVKATDVAGDVLIIGPKNRNRSFDGDVVAVRLFASTEWIKRKGASIEPASDIALIPDDELLDVPLLSSSIDDIAEKIDAIDLSCDAKQELQRTGEIVGIISRPDNALCNIVGYLRVISARDSPDALEVDPVTAVQTPTVLTPSTVVMFQPTSKKIPRAFVQNHLWPLALKSPDPEIASAAWNSIYSSNFGQWSTNQRSPRLRNLSKIGASGDVESETTALLKSNKIQHDESFSENIHQFLSDSGFTFPENPHQAWIIPEETIAARSDFRNKRVFSIDPPTARDLDDALSITQIDDNTFEIGVHIADVSYFIPEDSVLDAEAQRRCTSVYLVQKVIPMLPPILCEQLCSLNPGTDRLAFSVVWKMDRNGRLVSGSAPWFGRTVIRSCAKLDYATAQGLADGSLDPETIQCPGSFTPKQIADDCKILLEIAMARREHRFETGSLQMHRPKMHFSLDDDYNPTSVSPYELHDSNRMIEEFMLLANMMVAEKLAHDVPDVALLRRHDPPSLRKLEQVISSCSKLGYEIDGRSAKSLHTSLMNIQDAKIREFICVLLTVAMRRAQYCCISGMEALPADTCEEGGYSHYALGFHSYTHFTSPIRRYADVIVHRMLNYCLLKDAAAKNGENFSLCMPSSDSVDALAERCNAMKQQAKEAQDMSLLMYLSVLARQSPIIETGYVLDMGIKAFLVYIPRLGLEEHINIDRIANTEIAKIVSSASEPKHILLKWGGGDEKKLHIFDPFQVELGVSDTVPFRLQLSLLPIV